jgi:hypothetical protein
LQAFQLARDSCFSPLARATSASKTSDSPHLQLLTYNIQARYGAALCALSQLRNEDPGFRNPKNLEGSLVALEEIKAAMHDAQLDQEELYWLVLNGAFFARGALHNRTRLVPLTKSIFHCYWTHRSKTRKFDGYVEDWPHRIGFLIQVLLTSNVCRTTKRGLFAYSNKFSEYVVQNLATLREPI